MSEHALQNIEQLEDSLWAAADNLRANSKLTSSEYCMPVLGVIFLRHAPVSNAARAAATAMSTSAASASATCVITSPVAGLIVGNVLPEALLTHLPLISSLFALIFTLGSITAVAVAMESSLSESSRTCPSQ